MLTDRVENVTRRVRTENTRGSRLTTLSITRACAVISVWRRRILRSCACVQNDAGCGRERKQFRRNTTGAETLRERRSATSGVVHFLMFPLIPVTPRCANASPACTEQDKVRAGEATYSALTHITFADDLAFVSTRQSNPPARARSAPQRPDLESLERIESLGTRLLFSFLVRSPEALPGPSLLSCSSVSCRRWDLGRNNQFADLRVGRCVYLLDTFAYIQSGAV